MLFLVHYDINFVPTNAPRSSTFRPRLALSLSRTKNAYINTGFSLNKQITEENTTTKTVRERERKLQEMSGGMESMAAQPHVGGGANGHHQQQRQVQGGKDNRCGQFQMPLHYPRYTRAEYETMPEWKLDCLLSQYGLPVAGDLNQRRKFAMGAFLWPH